jgi:inosose dehydratase
MTQISKKIKQQAQILANFPSGIKSLSQQISRLLISLLIVILMGITTTLPANAEVRSGAKTPIFNPEEVRLGITPTGWSNSDDLTMDLNPPISYKQIISEISLAGFKGLQGAPKFPKDIATLKKDLEVRGLTISEPWVGTFFTIGAKEDSQKIFEDQMAFMKNFDSKAIVVAELGGAVHQQPIEPLNNRPQFTDKQWQLLIDGLNSLGDQAFANGMILSYHPHVGTGVETRADIDRLMAGTKDHNVNLLLDTGHLYYSGVTQDGILDLISTYGSRIKHVHLKNIRQNILDEAKQNQLSFLSAIRSGVFTVPGDKKGIIDFKSILNKLAEVKYQGWLMVEAEQDPSNTKIKPLREPLEYALLARGYLHKVTGL